MESNGAPIRPGVVLEDGPRGTRIRDPHRSAQYAVPTELAFSLRMAFLTGAAGPGAAQAWLEARHLIESARVARVEAWARALSPPAPTPLPIATAPGGRFACHGCGACCEGYVVWPIDDAERAAILARAADLAPHVPTPPERWFERDTTFDADGRESWALGRLPSGKCIFLDPDRRCALERRIDRALKPLTCRRFPLEIARRPDSLGVSLRVQCESLWRSHAESPPIAEQAGWLAEIAQGPAFVVVPEVVRLAGEVFVPYALARRVEEAALQRMSAGPDAGTGHLAVRGLVDRLRSTLRRAPEPEDLEVARRGLAGGAPLPRREEADLLRPLGAAERRRGILDALGDLCELVAAKRPPEEEGKSVVARANERLAAEIVRSLRAAEPLRADAGESDPAVADFVRGAFVHLIAGSRPLTAGPGLVHGYARLALLHRVARWGARFLAQREGRAAATTADWNRSLSVLDRIFACVDDAQNEALLGFYEEALDAPDALP